MISINKIKSLKVGVDKCHLLQCFTLCLTPKIKDRQKQKKSVMTKLGCAMVRIWGSYKWAAFGPATRGIKLYGQMWLGGSDFWMMTKLSSVLVRRLGIGQTWVRVELHAILTLQYRLMVWSVIISFFSNFFLLYPRKRQKCNFILLMSVLQCFDL